MDKITLLVDKRKVNPLRINQKLFEEKREDRQQEKVREIILDAFEELESNPLRYGRAFETLIPEKKEFENTNAQDLINQANEVGDHIADWVEQALEWAQRIFNGETWEAVCNAPDNCQYFRLVKWYNDKVQFIGGASNERLYWQATFVHYSFVKDCSYWFERAVPLVICYK